MKFTVKWEVHYYDEDIKLYCDIDQDEDHVKTLDDIFKFLDEQTTFLEELKIMLSFPVGLFVKALWKRIF